MSEQKWKTPRDAYCDGFNDGVIAGQKGWSAFLIHVFMLVAGLFIGAVVF